MKLVTKVNKVDLRKVLGKENWIWFNQAIATWFKRALLLGERYAVEESWDFIKYEDDFIDKGEKIKKRCLSKKDEWWVFEDTEYSITNSWELRKFDGDWEWNYQTFSGLGKYSYRYVPVGYDSTKGITYEGRLSFEGRRNSLKKGNHYFQLEKDNLVAGDYKVPHLVVIMESSTPERGAWD